jgi:pyruvate/2-oxoglutarate dehydrogenase complex dihydrolipoamide acyltransferase (E2) component
VQPQLTITLSSDHRVLDGASSAEFLQDVVAGLTDPEKFL